MTISSITTGITEENALINATVDNTTIGVATPSTGNFTVISANSINLTGDVLAATGRIAVSAATLTAKLTGATAAFSGIVSADAGLRVTIVSSDTINTGTIRMGAPTILSAAGTTQATGAVITATVGVYRLQGVTDGQTTGFLLPQPTANIGIRQLIINEGISANLWPNAGCAINGAAADAVFPLVTKTAYFVNYVTTSAYWVK